MSTAQAVADVNVALCNDRQYEAGLHVSLLSLLRSFRDPARRLRIFFFHQGFEEHDIERLRATLASTGKRHELVVRRCDTALFAGFPRLHGNALTYVRLLVPEIVPVDRVVFLDSDVIVHTDVADLFDSDLAQRTLGVVVTGQVRHANDQALLTSLGMSLDDPYFMPSVFVADAARWREQGYSAKCLEFLRCHRERRITVDQTAMNYVLRHDFHILDEKYNVNVYPTDRALPPTLPEAIFHLCGSPKPWDVLGHALHGNHDLFAGLLAQTALGTGAGERRLSPRTLLRTARLGRSYWKNLAQRLRRAMRQRTR